MENLRKNNLFSDRHIGTNTEERNTMLNSIGFKSMDDFIDAVVPSNILKKGEIDIGEEKTEEEKPKE